MADETLTQHEQMIEDRQVLQVVAFGDEGWEVLEETCARFGLDPLRTALGAIARELVGTSVRLTQETTPVVALLSHVVTGKMPDEVVALYDELVAADAG